MSDLEMQRKDVVERNVRPRLPDTRDKVTVSHLRKALDQLRADVATAAEAAWKPAGQLGGHTPDDAVPAGAAEVKDAPVFEALAPIRCS